MTDLPTYVLERVFEAPRALVWKSWTDPQILSRWYGPRVETVVHRLDLKPGGLWLVEMKWGGKVELSACRVHGGLRTGAACLVARQRRR